MKLNIIYVSDEEGNYNFYTFENNKIGIKFITISSNGINIYLNESTKK